MVFCLASTIPVLALQAADPPAEPAYPPLPGYPGLIATDMGANPLVSPGHTIRWCSDFRQPLADELWARAINIWQQELQAWSITLQEQRSADAPYDPSAA